MGTDNCQQRETLEPRGKRIITATRKHVEAHGTWTREVINEAFMQHGMSREIVKFEDHAFSKMVASQQQARLNVAYVSLSLASQGEVIANESDRVHANKEKDVSIEHFSTVIYGYKLL